MPGLDARRIAEKFAGHWTGTWVVTLDLVTILHLRVVDGIRSIAVATHPSMLGVYIEFVGECCEAPATCRLATTTDRNDAGVRWLTLQSRCPICLPTLLQRVIAHELAGLPPDAPRELAMTRTQDLRGRAVRIGGRTVMTASSTARQRLAGHAPARPAPLPPIPPLPPIRSDERGPAPLGVPEPRELPAPAGRATITPSRRVGAPVASAAPEELGDVDAERGATMTDTHAPGDGAGADAFNRFEAAGWERSAAPYDAFFAGVTSRLAGPVLDAVAAGDGTRLLDVATGPGYVAGAAAARGAQVTAVDVSAAMVELAARTYPEVAVRQGDAEALPFPDAAFDAVVCNFGVLHLGRPERAAAEAARVTAPGGRVALTVWDVPAKARLIGVFVDAMASARAAPPAELPVGPPFFRFSDQAEFAALLTGAGYGDVAVATVAFLHAVPSAEALWDGLLAGTVRTGPSILGQPPEVRQAIRAAFDRLAAEYAAPDGALALPVSVKLATGRKPT